MKQYCNIYITNKKMEGLAKTELSDYVMGDVAQQNIDTLVVRLTVPLEEAGVRSEWDYHLLWRSFSYFRLVKKIELTCCRISEDQFSNAVAERYVSLDSQIIQRANLLTLERALEANEDVCASITHIDIDPLCGKLHLVALSPILYMTNPQEITLRLSHLATPERLGMLRLHSFLTNRGKYNPSEDGNASEEESDMDDFKHNTWRLTLMANSGYQVNQVAMDIGAAIMRSGHLCLQQAKSTVARARGMDKDPLPGKWMVPWKDVPFLRSYNGTIWMKDWELHGETYNMVTKELKRVSAMVLVSIGPALRSGRTMDNLLEETAAGFIPRLRGNRVGTCLSTANNQIRTIGWRTIDVKEKEDDLHCGVMLSLGGKINAFISVTREKLNDKSMGRWRDLLLRLLEEAEQRDGARVGDDVEMMVFSLLFLAIRWDPNAITSKQTWNKRGTSNKRKLETTAVVFEEKRAGG